MDHLNTQASSAPTKRWAIYARERFPLATYLILCGGFTASGWALATRLSGSGIASLPASAGLRLMEELKDYKKDQIAHPGRPLPRGLVSPSEALRGVNAMAGLMVGLSLIIGLALNPVAGLLYLGLTAYLWLMYREFYVGESLARSQILYAITHQIVLVPFCLFAVACFAPEAAFLAPSIAYGVTTLGGFFAYEVCRKLDPRAHPILRTYLEVYGAKRSALLVLALLLVGAAGAARLGVAIWLIPIETALAVGVIVWSSGRPSLFKAVEALASVSLIAHIWSAFVTRWTAI